MVNMQTSDWLSCISMIIAIGSFFFNRSDTRKQIAFSRINDKLEQIKQKADMLRERACKYWSAKSIVRSDQTSLECDILSNIKDLQQMVEELRCIHKKRNEDIHKIQIEDLVELDKKITGGSFQEPTRHAEPDKCNQITTMISDFKKKISEVV